MTESFVSQEDAAQFNGMVINEVQLLLAEKRTSLATMRTGIAVFTLPVSVLSILIATSRHYNLSQVLHLFIPLLLLCSGLVILGTYLVIRSLMRIRHQDGLILSIKRKHSQLAEFID